MPDRQLVRRRAVLVTPWAGLAATALLAGCDNGDEIAPPASDAESSDSPSTASESAQEPEQTPDEALVDEVTGQLLGAMGVLGEARKFAALRPAVTPVLKAHRQHLQVLEAEGTSRTATSVPPHAAAALQAARRSEHRLQVFLVDAAGRAESGALAKLLASMSASTTQHLSLLPPELAQ